MEQSVLQQSDLNKMKNNNTKWVLGSIYGLELKMDHDQTITRYHSVFLFRSFEM